MPFKQSPFSSKSWLENCGPGGFEFHNSSGLVKTTIKGVPALFTPYWALDCGLVLKSYNGDKYSLFAKEISKRTEPYITIDLPPCSDEFGFSTTIVNQHTPSNIRIQWRHTRILELPSQLPSNRRKQVKRAEREMISCEEVQNWSNVHALHDESRNRKEITNNSAQLDKLLKSISSEDYSFAVEAKSSQGECIASGGFILLPNKRCLYAFGGQKRGPLSGIASVAMLAEAMRIAKYKGAKWFDFGGSTDPGVDRFYKEFGAISIPKPRLIKISWWLRPILRLLRSDLN